MVKTEMSDKKRNILIVSIVLSIFLVLIIAFVISNCSKPSNKQESPVFFNTQTKSSSLPNFWDVDVDSEPLMYDFLYGTINWHSNVLPPLTQVTGFMIAKDTEENRFYVSYSTPSESEGSQWAPPLFANAPLELESLLETTDGEGYTKDKFTNDLAAYAGTQKEGKWEFSWLWYDEIVALDAIHGTQGWNNYSNWQFVDLSPFIRNTEQSEIQKAIAAGQGIPTDYLRAKEVANIKKSGWDINDSFWNNVNYASHVKCKKIKNVEQPKDGYNITGDFVYLTPKYRIIGNTPVYFFTVNNLWDMHVADVLPEHGYQSVDDALSNPTYLSQEEINKTDTLRMT